NSYEYDNASNELAAFRVSRGMYFQETPDDCISVCREMVRSNLTHVVIGALRAPTNFTRSVSETARANQVWGDFLEELCNSTNGLNRVDGLYLKLVTQTPD